VSHSSSNLIYIISKSDGFQSTTELDANSFLVVLLPSHRNLNYNNMKLFSVLFLAIMLAFPASDSTYKPYVVGVESSESIATLKTKVEAQLKLNNIKVIGRTRPAGDNNRWVLAVTSADLDYAVQKVGGLSGFGSVLRIAFTREQGKTIVSYTNPAYWGNAYFQNKYPAVSANFNNFDAKLKKALAGVGTYSGSEFGSKSGLTSSKLRSYQYMYGMPELDDTEVLRKFDSYSEAVSHIDAKIKAGVPNVSLVYKHKIPGKNLTLYGFTLSGNTGESHFLPTIDLGSPKHTAFLPYEILVNDNEVHMLHGRYRIALSFPDLSMSTFMKIVSTPGDIETLMTSVTK